jgi:formylmethanofuran dehydrogenase subunit C
MPLIFEIGTAPVLPLEVQHLPWSTFPFPAPQDWARIPVNAGNEQVPLGDFLRISGSAEIDQTLRLTGDFSRVHGIGTGLNGGTILIEGPAGLEVGGKMTAGNIVVQGSADDWAGMQMRGGTLRIQGNAGNFVGAAPPGARRGMTRGRILVQGSAGHAVGAQLRRGLIAIGGDCGEGAGAGMIAGTLCLLGKAGRQIGLGMQRGTVLALELPAESVPPHFDFAARIDTVYLRLLQAELKTQGLLAAELELPTELDCYRGDRLRSGLGELYCVPGKSSSQAVQT